MLKFFWAKNSPKPAFGPLPRPISKQIGCKPSAQKGSKRQRRASRKPLSPTSTNTALVYVFRSCPGASPVFPIANRKSQIQNSSPLLNARVRVVVVDALVILRFRLVPGHFRVGIQLQGHVSHQILHKNRVFVGALRNRLIVLPLEQRI